MPPIVFRKGLDLQKDLKDAVASELAAARKRVLDEILKTTPAR